MEDRDSFYYRAIRLKLSDAPTTQYDPLAETPTKALFELYEKERVAACGTEILHEFIDPIEVNDPTVIRRTRA